MFPFVPRKVSQKARTHAVHTTTPLHSASAAGSSRLPPPADTAPNDAKGKSKSTDPALSDEDLAALLWLSLSDHSLWANVDLRRALASADEGWIPLSTLHHHSTYFAHLSARPPESVYVKAVRGHAAEMLEVRMRVSAPSKAGWYGTGESSPDDGGGYEIRKTDWREALPRARNSTRAEWESRTVYMECIPLAHRTLPSIYRFTSSLLSPRPAPQTLTTRIQAISLPPHHLDRPGSVPKPKGFALVTFSNEEDAARVVADWPWLPRRTSPPSLPEEVEANGQSEDPTALSVAREAVKFGFRALRKARWDALNEEYLAYRHRLLDEVAQCDSGHAPQATAAASTNAVRDERAARAPQERAPAGADDAQGSADSTTTSAWTAAAADGAPDPSAPFPPGCLVYVRNVHPETNKTTLKALFAAHGFGSSASTSGSGAKALDYVDYSKGMSSCHLRLSTPRHAQTLVSAFQTHPIIQKQGLDSSGTLLPEGSSDEERAKAISMEIVQGTREELYWSKVPEKVRREAVRKAIAQACFADGGDGAEEAIGEGNTGEHEGKRKRKRRRKA
ncbi:hypothetical protein BV20DRAFT_1043140 [Pilatotrama ljubarskyi]|nr:hypothetical protein BV20DRAFT_1043140 [Pilatotrama ljubarskyi]